MPTGRPGLLGANSLMTDQDTLGKLTRILRDLLGDESIVLTADTVREDVPNWDSYNYVIFIVAVEGEFGIKFPIADVESFRTVGEIVERIETLKG